MTSTAADECILVVDHSDSVRSLIRTGLEARGYSVLEARNGRDALTLLISEERPVHLIVTDLEMQQMSGAALLKALSSYSRLSRIPVIVTSGAVGHHAETSLGAPVFAVLRKPFEIRALLDLVGTSIGGT